MSNEYVFKPEPSEHDTPHLQFLTISYTDNQASDQSETDDQLCIRMISPTKIEYFKASLT